MKIIRHPLISKPGGIALQLRLHPILAPLAFVRKKTSTRLLLEVTLGGLKNAQCDGSTADQPQLLSIKVVPSPSVILTKSQAHVSTGVWPQAQTSKLVNSSLSVIPLATSMISVMSTLSG